VIIGPRVLCQGLNTVVPQLNEKGGVLAVTKVLLQNLVLLQMLRHQDAKGTSVRSPTNHFRELGRRKQVMQLLTEAHLGEFGRHLVATFGGNRREVPVRTVVQGRQGIQR
jgi:hypothetical protein